MAGYKQTDVGVIPDDWESRQLSDHFRIYAGGDVPKHALSEIRSESHPYPIFANALKRKGLYGFTSEKRAARNSLTITARGFLGHAEYRDEEFFPIVRLLVLEPTGALDPRYTALAVNERVTFAFESTGVPQLTAPQVGKYSVAAPGIEEQCAIATALSDVDALLAAQDALIAKKRAIKQGAMQELLTGKRRLPGFSGEWKVTSLGELALLFKGGINPSATPEALFTHFSLPAFDAFETPVVEVGASIGSNKFVVPQGAVLLSKLNPRIPRVWAPKEVPSNSVCSTEFLVLVPNESVDKEFFALACRSNCVIAQMELHAIGTTGSHQRIHPRQALKIEISIPTDQEEQSEISKALSDMAVEVTALEAQRAKTVQLKQGMMQALLTGRIRLV